MESCVHPPYPLDRRSFLARGGTAALGLLVAPPLRSAVSSGADSAVVRTPLGTLRGQRDGDVVSFLGVPFAEPPVGKLRFLPPRPARSWMGVQPALRYAAAPLQLRRQGTGEDCLYLNVWTPVTPGPHPVLVWFYGGGNQAGGTGGIADGSHFARDGVVCVTPAYRVGVTGFLDVSSVLGDGYAGSGNNGLLDQTLALRWVQENIAAFGGDPERVTVGGESAGAKDTCALLGSTATHGLFRQAIVESGGGQTVHTPESAAAVTGQFLECAGLRANEASTLLKLSAAQLMAAQRLLLSSYSGNFPFRAVVDGQFLDRTPLDGVRAGRTRGLRLLAGSNRDESSFFVKGAALDRPIGPKEVTNMAFDRVAAMEDEYRRVFLQLTLAQRKIRLLSAEEYWIPTLRMVEAHVGNAGEAYFYRFDVPRLRGPLAGEVPHASELGFVWDDEQLSQAEAWIGLRRSVHGAWVDFIFGRPPSLAQAETWRTFDLKERPVMLIDHESHVVLDPDGAERRMWEGWPA